MAGRSGGGGGKGTFVEGEGSEPDLPTAFSSCERDPAFVDWKARLLVDLFTADASPAGFTVCAVACEEGKEI